MKDLPEGDCMDWSHLISLIVGAGCGAVGTAIWLRSHKTMPVASSLLSSPPSTPNPATASASSGQISSSVSPADQQVAQHVEQIQHLERQLVDLQQAYFRALELGQFKAGFLARTSHELRSPINGVIGMHQLILADLCDDPAEEREFLQQAHTSVLKILGLLDELIAISKIEYGTGSLCLEPVQLAELFKEVQAAIHLQAENRNLRLQVVIPEPEIEVLADWKQLRQVLISLLDTAIAHMDEGQICLRVCPSGATEPVRIWLEDQRPASAWHEAFDLLSARDQSIQAIQTMQAPQKVVPEIIEQILAETGDSLHPSMGLSLLMNSILLYCMGGQLTILHTPIVLPESDLTATQSPTDAASDAQWPNLTRLECCFPRP